MDHHLRNNWILSELMNEMRCSVPLPFPMPLTLTPLMTTAEPVTMLTNFFGVGWVGGDAEEAEAGIRAVSKDIKT